MPRSVARQPIFDKNLNLFGYELLFRGVSGDVISRFDPDKATSSVLVDGLFSVGMDKVAQGKLAFVNFSRGLLISDLMLSLPKNQIAIEVLESVEPDPDVLVSCETLKELGYTIVLDDFIYRPKLEPLIKLADILKVDVLNSSDEYCAEMPKRFQNSKRLLLAEKVEDYERYRQTVSWGYSLFQGYFFSRPQLLSTDEISPNKLIYFQLLRELQDPFIEAERLEHIIQRDAELTYKIIRYVNSAAFGFKTTIDSLRHAISLVGNQRLKNLTTLILFKVIGHDKPSALATTAIVRGRFAELIALKAGLVDKAGEAFLIGLFSLIEALVDRPMAKVLAELNLNSEITDALLRKPGKLTSVLEIVIAYEQATWEKYDLYLPMIGLREETVGKLYLEALGWVAEIERQD